MVSYLEVQGIYSWVPYRWFEVPCVDIRQLQSGYKLQEY